MESGIRFSRGSSTNVLARGLDAVKDFENDRSIFRLTADNIIADGNLLELMYSEFIDRGLEYLTASGGGRSANLGNWRRNF